MTGSAARPGLHSPAMDVPDTREAARAVSELWWLWLVTGIVWIIGSLVILQFDSASITTIGIIIGVMFTFAAVQQFALAGLADSLRWLWALVGVLFLICAGIAFVNPKETFAGLADVLGFLFLVVGIWWIARAFLERAANPLWWLGLISGIALVVLAFWTSGQFFLEKAYTLLVFAGIWALMQGITDIIRAFQVRAMRDAI